MKRFRAPYRLISVCDECGEMVDRKLWEQYLSFPFEDDKITLYVSCDNEFCENYAEVIEEKEAEITVNINLRGD